MFVMPIEKACLKQTQEGKEKGSMIVNFERDVRSNAYRSMPSNQDVFSLLISCICIPVILGLGLLFYCIF